MTVEGRHPVAEFRGSSRVAFRLAVRSLRRRRAASVLIVATLAVPVFAAAVLAQVWSATYGSADRQASWVLGEADFRIGGSNLNKAISDLPAGSVTAPLTTGQVVVSRDGAFSLVSYVAADVTAPISSGMYVTRTGRAPHSGSEVAVTRRLAAALGVRVGDSIYAGNQAQRLAVVGVIDVSNSLSQRALILEAAAPLARTGSRSVLVRLPASASWSPTNLNGLDYADRHSVEPRLSQQAAQAAGLTVIAGFAFAQFALLAAAAFTAMIRQQRRELGIVFASGGTKKQVTRIILAGGTVLGGIGGITGITGALITFRLTQGPLETVVGHPLAHVWTPIGSFVVIGVVAMAVGLLAAYMPARTIARQPVRRVLTARIPDVVARGRRMVGVGLVIAAAGIAATLYGVRPDSASSTTVSAGAALALIGLVLCAPSLIGALGRLADRTPLVPRLALRHSARHRIRTGAAVAAVCAATAGTLGIVLAAGADTRTGIAKQPLARIGQVLVPAGAANALTADDLRSIDNSLSARYTAPIELASATMDFLSLGDDPTQPPPDLSATIAVGSPDMIRTITGTTPTASTLAALRNGQVIVFFPELIRAGQVHLQTQQGTSITHPGTLITIDANYRQLPSALISASTAQHLGLSITSGGLVITPARPPTAKQIATANSVILAAQLHHDATQTPPQELTVATDPTTTTATDPLLYVLAGVSTLVTLVASAVAVSLSLAEMRDDLSTLAAIGASPRVGRSLTAAQAFIIVGIGTLLGALAALAPAAGLVALRPDLTWHVSWWLLLGIVAGAPLLAIATTAAFARSRPTLVRRLL